MVLTILFLTFFGGSISYSCWIHCCRETPQAQVRIWSVWVLKKNISKTLFWINFPSLKLCVVLPFLEVVGNKKNILYKSNYSWLGSVMRFESVSTGLQINCRSALLVKSHSAHHHLAQHLSYSALRGSTHSLRPFLEADNCLSNWLTFVELSFPWDITPSTHTHQKKNRQFDFALFFPF